jgi:hypothetical protein
MRQQRGAHKKACKRKQKHPRKAEEREDKIRRISPWFSPDDYANQPPSH